MQDSKYLLLNTSMASFQLQISKLPSKQVAFTIWLSINDSSREVLPKSMIVEAMAIEPFFGNFTVSSSPWGKVSDIWPSSYHLLYIFNASEYGSTVTILSGSR